MRLRYYMFVVFREMKLSSLTKSDLMLTTFKASVNTSCKCYMTFK